jgi:orotidine-5'-phosphate decarboxylase
MTRQALTEQIFQKKSMLCVGLDTDPELIPKHLLNFEDPVFEFNRQIIDATRHCCVAYKPNLAFYEAQGLKGWVSLQKTIQYIGNEHFIIADAKRGDIGNTSARYAKAFFEELHCDAVTIAPYMGKDSVTPFLGFEGKWAIVLGLTSNPGSADFQRLRLDGTAVQLWEQVLQTVASWGTAENTMFVIGATHPEDFHRVREILPDHFLLVPGIGAQGGDLEAVLKAGSNKDGGLLINASRSILYAGQGTDFAEKACTVAEGFLIK